MKSATLQKLMEIEKELIDLLTDISEFPYGSTDRDILFGTAQGTRNLINRNA